MYELKVNNYKFSKIIRVNVLKNEEKKNILRIKERKSAQ